MPQLGAALAAGALAWLLRGLPYKLGLMAAVLTGVIVGLALSRWRRGAAAQTEAAR